MNLVEKGEVFVKTDEGLKFVHTTAVFQDGPQFYVAKMDCKMREVPEELNTSDKHEGFFVTYEKLFPRFDATLTRAPCHSADSCYVKKPRLLLYQPGEDSLGAQMLQEAHVLEAIKSSQHPNVQQYHGCVELNNQLVGLCLEKYLETLTERVQRNDATLDVDHCVNGITSGLKHIHSLGYCHNDVNPGNIMFKEDGTPVLIDFDSCIPTGQKLGYKAGTLGFWDDSATHSLPQNDFTGLRFVKEFIERHLESVKSLT
ncbi:Serine/threonine-protein kinase/endoribonuclease IRE2 [Gracilariopsis chorda]|uniref:Serine/threonine-protein kinase/endoribonuclease IRE2 n=1 Tax=Gracilariopsis chorda TaxID=448386 RepID=A0A2V3J3U4_9FLOR|nr:Serine/threonine-protein kinase/endoribonuclease IRE2 [Gracilariopsis chorda]|eukprot:PXF48983.1 Serine/threonine-protein kinase/endoribonuclease IRE2 [Gracilariopsis chorda]